MASDRPILRASTSEGAGRPAAKSDPVPSPASSHGLQDWYLRACDGEWDAGPGVTVDPLEVGRAWAGLPTRAADAAEAPGTGHITGLPRPDGDPPRGEHPARASSRPRRRP